MGANPRLNFGDSSPENSLMHSGTVVTDPPVGIAAMPKPDFSGWASKYNLKCSDGRTILPDAFEHQDKVKVPLVWQHGHDDPGNVLGHAILEHRKGEGVYTHGFFNGNQSAKNAKELVVHEDIDSLSIFANQLQQVGDSVRHGVIREVSLVLARANPGALIDNLELQHAESGELVTIEDEAVIYTGEPLKHGDDAGKIEDVPEGDPDGDGPTVQEVFDSMDDQQKEVVHHFVGAALEHAAANSGDNPDDITHSAGNGDPTNGGKKTMKRNVFEENGGGSGTAAPEKHELTHDALREIVADARQRGSFKAAVEAYALQHGINNIEVLFPDARAVSSTPDMDKRRTEWVKTVLDGTHHAPFSRIKSLVADLTVESARALGYIKGNLKKEEFFGLTKRTTSPTTIYKKQKLDRDDIIDVTDMNVVEWLWSEMRLMYEEELARAILVGDGRPVEDPANPGEPNPDKVKDPAGATDGQGIRSILNDHDLYAPKIDVEDANTKVLTDEGRREVVDAITLAMVQYKGSGQPTFFTKQSILSNLLLTRDADGKRMYRTASDLAAELGVDRVVAVEVFDSYVTLVGIIVNLRDYTVGTDRGGDLTKFEDFDIDYNQYKYLMEGRQSGALTKIRSALVVRHVNNVA
jgi:hypothetical protein